MVTMLSNQWDDVITKVTTQTLTATTPAGLVDATELSFPVAANTFYEIEVHMLFNATLVSDTNPQVIVGFGEDSDATRGTVYITAPSTAGSFNTEGKSTDKTDRFTIQSIVYDTDYSLSPAVTPILCKGIHGGAGGTWVARWGTRTARTDNYHLLAGSTLRWRTVYPAT
jgi:hypothetical protein